MSVQETVPASGGVGPAGFDFNAYINGTAKFPTFEHVVYLDQASGAKLHTLREEYDGLAERGREILRIQSSSAEATSRSFVDEEAEALADELEKIEARTSELAPQINQLRKAVQDTALRLCFQSGTAEKFGSVIRQAEREFHKKRGRKDDTDLEYMTAKSKAVLAAQLNAYCTGIVLADGTEQEKPDAQGFINLLDRLIASEAVRLMETLSKNLDGNREWADEIDAGFPGGRDDAPGEFLGDPDPADSPFLGVAAPDAPDGGEPELGG